MVSVVVVNWNGASYLRDCLAAILAQEPGPQEVLVVDNCSDDASRELVAADFPQVRVLALPRNDGPGAARNRGVEAAACERVVCVDNDVVLQPGVLAALAATMDRHPQAAMVQARSVLDAAPDTVHYDGADLHYLGMLLLHNWYRPLREATSPQRPMGAGVALCFLTRRTPFLAIGGFFEPMFFFFEDNDFALRLRLRGHEVWLAPDAVVRHRGGTAGLSMRGEKAKQPPRRTYLHSRNRTLLLLACLHWRTLLLTLPAQMLYGGVHLAFAIAQGHTRAWFAGKWGILALLPATLRRRREVQRTRTRSDRDLLTAAPFTFNPHIGQRGAGALARRGLDAVFITWWRCVRWACG